MATKVTNAATAAPAGDTIATVDTTPPVLGTVITVRVAEGVLLLNNELGVHFAPGVDTPQTVTTTTLRRLLDGDLTRVA